MFKAEGVCYFAPQAGPYGSSGVEDRIAIVCGLYIGVEVKADASKKMTAKQELRRKAVFKADGWHFLVYDKKTIEELRQFIHYVRACNSRQKGISGCFPRPRYHLENYPLSQAGERKLVLSASPPGGNASPSELGVLYPGADPVLLQLARPVQTDGAPENNFSLLN